MDTIKFSVHEFMTLMGRLNERDRDGDGVPATSIWHKWKKRYQDLDKELEKLDMMDRADMLFDGKVKFEDVPKSEIVMSRISALVAPPLLARTASMILWSVEAPAAQAPPVVVRIQREMVEAVQGV